VSRGRIGSWIVTSWGPTTASAGRRGGGRRAVRRWARLLKNDAAGVEAAGEGRGASGGSWDFSRLEDAPVGHRHPVGAVPRVRGRAGVLEDLLRCMPPASQVANDPSFGVWYAGPAGRFDGFDRIESTGGDLRHREHARQHQRGAAGFSGGSSGGVGVAGARCPLTSSPRTSLTSTGWECAWIRRTSTCTSSGPSRTSTRACTSTAVARRPADRRLVPDRQPRERGHAEYDGVPVPAGRPAGWRVADGGFHVQAPDHHRATPPSTPGGCGGRSSPVRRAACRVLRHGRPARRPDADGRPRRRSRTTRTSRARSR
jgi:hypothetical protein